jgi:hypothetical protein
MTTDDRRVCAVCGRVLDEHVTLGDKGDKGSVVWFHGIASLDEADVQDHPAIPVRVDEVPAGHIRPRCDFCFADDPAFVLPVKSFIYLGVGSKGNWAACGNCAQHITRNDWKGLLRRAVVGFKARHQEGLEPAAVNSLRGMYRELRKNVTGSLYRL